MTLKRIMSLCLIAMIVTLTTACASKPAQNNTNTTTNTSSNAGTTKEDTNKPTETKTENTDNVENLKLGIILPFTGSNARIAELQYNGMELFINNFNEAGGFKNMGGAKIEIVKADTTGAPEVGVTEIERLITKENVSAIVGPYNSAVGSATAPIAEKYQTPYILSNCTADEILQTAYKYVYRANHSNSNDAIDIVKYLKFLRETRENADFKKFAIVYENTDWGSGMSKALEKYLVEEYGGEIVINEAYQANAADFSSIINKIKSSGAEVTIPVAYLADALLFTQQMYELKCESIIFASSGGFTTPDYAQKVGEAGNYVLTVAAWDKSILPYKPEEAAKLNDQYKSLYGEDLDGYAVNGYLAAAVMIGAIERAGSFDREKINEALAATNLSTDDPALIFHPYTGLDFNGEVRGMTHQNTQAQGIVLQVINGEFKLVGPDSLVGDKSELVWPIPSINER